MSNLKKYENVINLCPNIYIILLMAYFKKNLI